MSLSNTDREMLWVDGWNNLDEVRQATGAAQILENDWTPLSLDEAQLMIQNRAYQSEKVSFEEVRWQGKRALRLHFAVVTEYDGN